MPRHRRIALTILRFEPVTSGLILATSGIVEVVTAGPQTVTASRCACGGVQELGQSLPPAEGLSPIVGPDRERRIASRLWPCFTRQR
jgi:hypothetical protein